MKVGYIALLAVLAAAPVAAAELMHGAGHEMASEPATVDATGRLNGLDAATGTVNITHTPIPALGWPAMTMDFTLVNKALADGLKPGQAVKFTIRKVGQTDYVISAIEPTS